MNDAVEELRFKLFPSTMDQPFTSSTLSKGLKRDSRLYLGHSFGIKEYRDIQTTFSRHHPDPRTPPASSNRENLADSQRGHSTHTAVTWYGLEEGLPQGISASKIMGYERVSNWWNHLTGKAVRSKPKISLLTHTSGQDQLKGTHEVELPKDQANSLARLEASISERISATARSCIQEMRSEINEAIAIGFSTLPTASRGGTDRLEPPRVRMAPHPSLLVTLRQFLSNPNASFKTPEQAEALEVAFNRQEHLLLIGPTAMGKSLIYMLPAASVDRTLVTLVLLPLSSLHLDFERRCREANISNSRWEPNLVTQPKTSIVYVSPEHAQTKDFSDYATSLHLTKKLARFVIDEPHLAVQHASFRYCFASLKPLISARKFPNL